MSTGLKANSDGSAAIQVGGSDVITLTSGGAATFLTSPTTVQAGTAAAPSITFSGDTNTGIYSPSADTVAIGTGGTEALRVNSSQNVGIGTTSPQSILELKNASPTITLNGTTNNAARGLIFQSNGTQFARITSNFATGEMRFLNGESGQTGYMMTFFTDSTERARITSGGDFCIGDTAVSAAAERLVVKSAGATSATAGIKIINSSGTELFFVRSDGAFRTGSAAVSPYNNTTATAANVWINTDGTLLRSTSSLKYKTDVSDATHGLLDVLKLRSVIYKSKNTVDGEQVFGGLIAEEVHEAGLTEFVQYAEDGTPDALSYGNMVSLCIKAIQELNAKVEAQAAEIAALKGAA